jgi:hypothetical protein
LVSVGDEIGSPSDIAGAQPGGQEAVAAVLGEDRLDGAWSAFEDAAQSASATSPSPSSNRRLPRRDWQ